MQTDSSYFHQSVVLYVHSATTGVLNEVTYYDSNTSSPGDDLRNIPGRTVSNCPAFPFRHAQGRTIYNRTNNPVTATSAPYVNSATSISVTLDDHAIDAAKRYIFKKTSKYQENPAHNVKTSTAPTSPSQHPLSLAAVTPPMSSTISASGNTSAPALQTGTQQQLEENRYRFPLSPYNYSSPPSKTLTEAELEQFNLYFRIPEDEENLPV